MQNEPDAVDLRSPKEVAALLGVTVDCLGNWRRAGDGPPFITIGSRKVVYDMKDIVSWLEAQKRSVRITAPQAVA
jgi:hypothetical protein